MGHLPDDIVLPTVAPFFGLTYAKFDVKLKGRWNGKVPQGKKRELHVRLFISEQEYCSNQSFCNRAKSWVLKSLPTLKE